MLREPHLPDFLTSLVDASFREKLEVLDAVELSDRYRLALGLLQRQISVRLLDPLVVCALCMMVVVVRELFESF